MVISIYVNEQGLKVHRKLLKRLLNSEKFIEINFKKSVGELFNIIYVIKPIDMVMNEKLLSAEYEVPIELLDDYHVLFRFTYPSYEKYDAYKDEEKEKL